MRIASLVLVLFTITSVAFADEPAVVVLRGSSAPPTPWYEPPTESKVIVQPAYVPLYYLPIGFGPFIHRHPHTAAKRNR